LHIRDLIPLPPAHPHALRRPGQKPIAQLTIYALALTRLVPGLKLFDITCGWFNETCYNEFYPRLALPRPKSLRRILDEIHEEEAASREGRQPEL
jgi:hypothetical protein